VLRRIKITVTPIAFDGIPFPQPSQFGLYAQLSA
jgi:hypothetical protein